MIAGIDKQLQVGQTVQFSDQPTGYAITILPIDQPGAKVVAIGPDYVVLDEEAAGIKTRIPAHLIKSVAPAEIVQQVAA
jgi:hypothetical protein